MTMQRQPFQDVCCYLNKMVIFQPAIFVFKGGTAKKTVEKGVAIGIHWRGPTPRLEATIALNFPSAVRMF